MYTDFYKLTRPAFELRCQPSFWWQGGSAQSCYDTLFAGVTAGEVFQLVSGGAGSGKSALLGKLCTDFADTVRVALLAGADAGDFYNAVISAFGFAKEIDGKVEFIIELSRLLKEGLAEGTTFLLVIDDADRLAQSVFEDLRLLLGLEKDGQPLLRLLLAGEPEVMTRLSLPENEILRQKLTNHLQLVPLSEQECGDYIEHRLRVAGAEEQIFAPESVAAIHRSAQGLPRAIHLLCTSVLESGAEQQERQLTASFVEHRIRVDWEELLTGDLRQISQEKKRARPTRQSAAETAAFVAAAVKAAVGDNGEGGEGAESDLPAASSQQEHTSATSSQPPGKGNNLLLRSIVVAAICFCLFWLYQYISATKRVVRTESTPPQQSSLPLPQKKTPPVVTTDTENAVRQPPVFTKTPVPPVSTEVPEIPEAPETSAAGAENQQNTNPAKKSREGDGRINVHSLDVIE